MNKFIFTAIRVGPGLYQLTGPLRIQAGKKNPDTTTYILEATVMPDDSNWSPLGLLSLL